MSRLSDHLWSAFWKLFQTLIALVVVGGAVIWWISAYEDGPDGAFAILGVSLLIWALIFGATITVLYQEYRSFRDDRK